MRRWERIWDRIRFRLRWTFSPRHRRFFRDSPEAVFLREFGGRIAAGPFHGMRYLPNSSGSALAPKLLGCYERELHPALVALLDRHPRAFIDVGAAEGYYAVGVPFVEQTLQSYAVDIDPVALERVRGLAVLNGVAERVRCSDSLDTVLADAGLAEPRLLMCDVEGDERRLLDPSVRPALATCDLVVELHVDDRGVSPRAELESRFRHTHQSEFIPVQPRSPRDAAAARWCRDPVFLREAVDERRQSSVGWLVLRRSSR